LQDYLYSGTQSQGKELSNSSFLQTFKKKKESTMGNQKRPNRREGNVRGRSKRGAKKKRGGFLEVDRTNGEPGGKTEKKKATRGAGTRKSGERGAKRSPQLRVD